MYIDDISHYFACMTEEICEANGILLNVMEQFRNIKDDRMFKTESGEKFVSNLCNAIRYSVCCELSGAMLLLEKELEKET